ncbi:hypothetical protein QA641_32990 [Bradyrhizobium sp. CB1650]|uniref:hypothetical protein n=1 Tax=Bradyrhizobium sp. CB1650 TaxID=3039153 RepID=UPI0024360031|nr:hypothetical protein [Bradyrhizobium sp. CB1650]WGD50374.1 hypothetical protein QA641_32990 [Bradyrhizobium sp. CB1650]
MAERGIAKSRYVGLPKSAPNLFVWWRCMMQITGSAWKDDSRQVVEEDSAAYKRDVLGLVPSRRANAAYARARLPNNELRRRGIPI